jgi:pectate lyase
MSCSTTVSRRHTDYFINFARTLNNLYEKNGSSSYKFQYAWRVGKNSQILAENNVLNIAKVSTNSVLSKLGGNQFSDRGTILNGNSVKIAAINKESNISWKPSYFYNLDSSSEVEKKVLSNAGSDVLKLSLTNFIFNY